MITSEGASECGRMNGLEIGAKDEYHHVPLHKSVDDSNMPCNKKGGIAVVSGQA